MFFLSLTWMRTSKCAGNVTRVWSFFFLNQKLRVFDYKLEDRCWAFIFNTSCLCGSNTSLHSMFSCPKFAEAAKDLDLTQHYLTPRNTYIQYFCSGTHTDKHPKASQCDSTGGYTLMKALLLGEVLPSFNSGLYVRGWKAKNVPGRTIFISCAFAMA